MNFIDLIAENLLVYLAGVGTALIPYTVEKIEKNYNNHKYREVRKVYGILVPELTVGKISSPNSGFQLKILLNLSKMDEWEQIKQILEEIIRTARIHHRERLYIVLGKELTEKWVQNCKKRENLLVTNR